jgi:CheY-like chemotaxis protein
LHCPVYFGSGCKCEDEQVCTDVLITDNKMPNMTGIEFLELQDKQGCKLDHRSKAIMSGNFSDEDIQKITKLGCKIFYKPFNLNEILEWIKECETRILPKRKLIVYNHVQV